MANRDTRPIQRRSGGDMTGSQWRFSKETPTGVVPCNVAGERADGIFSGGFPRDAPTEAGQGLDLDIERLMRVEAGGVFQAGAELTTDSVGRAVLAGPSDFVNAIAVEAATAAGQRVTVSAPYARGPSTTSTAQPVVTVVNAPLAPAPATSGALFVIPIDIPDAATATYNYVTADKIEVVDVVVVKDGAGAGNTVQLKDGSGAAISDAIIAAADGATTHAGSLPKAKRTLAAGAGFQITATRAAGSMACQVFLHVLKRP